MNNEQVIVLHKASNGGKRVEYNTMAEAQKAAITSAVRYNAELKHPYHSAQLGTNKSIDIEALKQMNAQQAVQMVFVRKLAAKVIGPGLKKPIMSRNDRKHWNRNNRHPAVGEAGPAEFIMDEWREEMKKELNAILDRETTPDIEIPENEELDYLDPNYLHHDEAIEIDPQDFGR